MKDARALTGSLEALKSALEKANALKAVIGNDDAAERRLKLADLVESLLEAKEKVLEAREEYLSGAGTAPAAESRLPGEETVEFDGRLYWKVSPGGKREGPFCQRCRDIEQRWVRLHEERRATDFGESFRSYYSCNVCKTTYDS